MKPNTTTALLLKSSHLGRVTVVRQIDVNAAFPDAANDGAAMRFALLRHSPHDQW